MIDHEANPRCCAYIDTSDINIGYSSIAIMTVYHPLCPINCQIARLTGKDCLFHVDCYTLVFGRGLMEDALAILS
jgi:hypothetical protein